MKIKRSLKYDISILYLTHKIFKPNLNFNSYKASFLSSRLLAASPSNDGPFNYNYWKKFCLMFLFEIDLNLKIYINNKIKLPAGSRPINKNVYKKLQIRFNCPFKFRFEWVVKLLTTDSF
jgi:hypothetical protein